jgi:hypothetical protein
MAESAQNQEFPATLLSRRVGTRACGFTTVGVVAIGLFDAVAGDVWAGLEYYHANGCGDCVGVPLSNETVREYCERQHLGSPIRTNANAWSNLCYLFVASMILSIAIEDQYYTTKTEFLMARWPSFSVQMGLGTCYLAIGSFCFHASLSLHAQRTDVGGMFAVFSAIFSFSLFKYCLTTGKQCLSMKAKDPNGHLAFVLSPSLMLVILQVLPFRLELPIGGVCLIGYIVLEFVVQRGSKSRLQWYLLGGTLVFFVFGWMFNKLDINRKVCIKDTYWFQGHAFWHFLTSVSIFFGYLMNRCDKQPISTAGTDTETVHVASPL